MLNLSIYSLKLDLTKPVSFNFCKSKCNRGVGRYEIVVGHIIKPLLKKWWGTCRQAPPMVTPLCKRYELATYLDCFSNTNITEDA